MLSQLLFIIFNKKLNILYFKKWQKLFIQKNIY